jgi:hypothetical protein
LSAEQRMCVVVVCDQCQRTYNGYEDEYTVHFDSLDEFVREQDNYDDDTRWRIQDDKHYCAVCACAQDGHPRDEQIHTFSDGRRIQWCRCGQSWPVKEQAS